MVSVFLSHSWKKLTRSMSFSKDAAAIVGTGFLGLILVVYAIGLGYSLEFIIVNALKQSNAIGFLNSLLLYYFVIEFIMRYLMQNLPVFDIQPYLHLPVKRSNMVHFLLAKSLLHILNVLVLLLFTPFAFNVIAVTYDLNIAFLWLVSLWLLSLTMHQIVVLFKKKLDDSVWGIITLSLLIGLFAAADYFQWFKLSEVSATAFNNVIKHPIVVIVPLLMFVSLYYISFKFFVSNIYPEEISTVRQTTFHNRYSFSLLKNKNVIAELINVEVKLILRNKRPRTLLYMSAFFLFYGLIFYNNPMYSHDKSWFLIFLGVFITGVFMMNYGQMSFSWQSSHFDFALTRPISLRQYVESKYWLLIGVTILCTILTVPYVYFGWRILAINIAMAMFNIGVNSFILLNAAMWSPKKITLSKGVMFNYEGLGAAQWLMGIPLLLMPYMIYLPFKLSGFENIGIAAVGITGFIGFMLRNKLLTLTTNRLQRLKYSIASGFRKFD